MPDLDQPADSGDWLADSRGFRVEAASGPLGIVEEVHRDADSGRPETLVVRAGVLGTQHLDVPVDHVSGVVTSRRLVLLSTDAPS